MPAGWEWAILVLIALLLFGGSRLPGIGRNAGRAVRTFSDELKSFHSEDGRSGEDAGSTPGGGAQTPAAPDEPERR